MRQRHGDAPKKKTRKRAESTPELRDHQRRRRSEVETHDKTQHPVDQQWRGWNFEDWLDRPAGRCEKAKNRGKKLTEELCVDIARVLAEGLFQYHVEGLLGLSDRSIANWCRTAKRHEAKRRDWIKRAKRFKTKAGAVESLGPKPPITVHMKLQKIVRKAEAIGETTLFGALVGYALDGDAKTAQWILERKYPERYGRLALRGDVERDEDGKAKANPIRDLADALEAVAERSNA